MNEAKIIPYFLRHYRDIVDKYVILDNGSTDDSVPLLSGDERIELRSFETIGDSFVAQSVAIQDQVWKDSRAAADWVVMVDLDEHVFHADLRAHLARCRDAGVTAVRAVGYEMVATAFPTTAEPLWRTVTCGARERLLDKVALFDPNAVAETNYGAGRHSAALAGRVIYEREAEVSLLHYKHLGADYVCERNAILSLGLRERDQANGWGVHYLRDRSSVEDNLRRLMAAAGPVPGLAQAGAADAGPSVAGAPREDGAAVRVTPGADPRP